MVLLPSCIILTIKFFIRSAYNNNAYNSFMHYYLVPAFNFG
jgi:hypothetical protein